MDKTQYSKLGYAWNFGSFHFFFFFSFSCRGAYLYRKERSSNKKRLRKSAATSEDSADASTSPSKLRPRGLSEDNFSSGSTFEKHEEDCYMSILSITAYIFEFRN